MINLINLSKQSKQQCTQDRQKWAHTFSENYEDSLNFSLDKNYKIYLITCKYSKQSLIIFTIVRSNEPNANDPRW